MSAVPDLAGLSVLTVLVDDPWPPVTGDRQRVQAMLRSLAGADDLRLFLTPDGTTDAAVADDAGADGRPQLPTVEQPRERSHLRAATRAILGVPASRPPMMAFYRQPAVRDRLRRTMAQHGADVVVTHHLGGAGLVDGIITPSRVILDLPNFEVERFARMAELATGIGKARWTAERQLSTRWVRRRLSTYGAVTVTSERDAEGFSALAPRANVVVAPNGTTPPASLRPDPRGRSLLFLGDLSYLPNRDAAAWFVQHVLPFAPEIEELRVVGRGPEVVGERVRSLGFVADLEPEWAAAVAMVVPLRAGGGTRLKVLDAFGQGVPVISTALGVEGLDAVPGTHYLRAETPEEWVRAVRRVIAEPSLRAGLTTAARGLVDDRYVWTRAMAPFAEAVGTVGRRALPISAGLRRPALPGRWRTPRA